VPCKFYVYVFFFYIRFCFYAELAPQIITKLKDQKVATGEQVLFEIELTKGDALVKWTKDGKELQLNDNVRLTIDGKRQKLEIVKASKTDTGVYGCQVHDQTCTAKLTIEGRPVWTHELERCLYLNIKRTD